MTTQRENINTSSRIPELDGLRGLAILFVISFHYINNQLVHTPHVFAKLLYTLTSFGWIGVDLFFVLSGFLITRILLRTRTAKNYFSVFFSRRLLRIIPNYYLLILFSFAISLFPSFSDNYFLNGNRTVPWWYYLSLTQNLYMAHIKNMGNSALSVTWSIGIEEQFYIIFPIIVFFIRKSFLPYLMIIAMLAAWYLRIGHTSWIPPYVLPYCRMDAIMGGALVAYFEQENNIHDLVKKFRKWLYLIVLSAVLVGSILFILYQDLGPLKNLIFTLIFSTLLIFSLVDKSSLWPRFLRMPPLIWVGTISYSLYLFHYLILGLCHHIFGKEVGIYSGRDILISLLALLISLSFSWIVYTYLETPFVKLGKKLSYTYSK